VHLNQKQDSEKRIAKFRESNINFNNQIKRISEISMNFYQQNPLEEFDKLIAEHEQIISSPIKLKPVKEILFQIILEK
jgi:hypothetical protein